MSRTASVCIITGYGINADLELERAFQAVGAQAERIHFNDLVSDFSRMESANILAFPGGFSFGDHLGAGLVFAARFRRALGKPFHRFLDRGGLVLGICNGFQILVKMGVLPNLSGADTPEVSLIHNNSGVFEDSWVRISFDPDCPSVWTRGLGEMDVPIRHGEGRFVTKNEDVLDNIENHHLGAVRYVDRNPNGSEGHIAGICDLTGRILGLMPHPEAFLYPENHPRWTREPVLRPEGLELLRNGVREASHGQS